VGKGRTTRTSSSSSRTIRDTSGQFDAVASVEMVEALGREYWPAFFDCLARNLKPGGRAAIQFIAMRDDLFEAYARNADFIQAYVFPAGC
jgi:cyclopropane-fatty-acyl-phospholipid synthase